MKSHYHHIFIDARSVMVPVFYSNQERFSSVKALFSLITSIMKEFHPQTICVVFGDHLSKSKKEFYPKYGSTRNERRDENEKKALANEIEIATYFLSHCPVRSISPIGIEAKDAIGYLSKILQKPKLIVSSNKDYFQILRPDLQVMEPKDGLMISETEAELILGFPIKYYLLWKSIVGDSQNGTHGIKRIGRDRAKRLIQHTLKTGRKFPLGSFDQKILSRNKYLFSVGEVLTKEEKHEVLKHYQFERTKPGVGVFIEHDPSSFGIQNEIKEIFVLSKETRPPKSNREGITLQ